jgi:DNA primase
MGFTPQFLDELRARLPVSEVVGRRVRLKKTGREYSGLSPFNKERTPSFTVNDQKGFWHDFSSGKHGDIFGFVMETEGVSFPEAVERLAAAAGIAVPATSREAEAEERRRRTLHEVIELAAKYFEATLAGRQGAKARGYLADRGIDPSTQLKFRIGYATGERFALKEHLGNAGVSTEDMIAAGLLVAGDDIPVPYDRFRDRVMFPITDWRGRIIAFGGRALEKDVAAKYLNSPETPLFHKGGNLYNGAAARQAIHDGAKLIVVEGYVDVIAMVTAGFPGTVAPLGTALTEDQLRLLWKMDEEPVLCFDGDGAGRRAAYRAVDLALAQLAPGKTLQFAMLPEGQDPDDLIRSGGTAAMKDVLAQAQPLAAVLWTRETENGNFDTPERRAGLETRVGGIIAGIQNEAVRKYYRQDFEARLRAFFAPAPTTPRPRFADRPGRMSSGRRGAGPAEAPLVPRSTQLTMSPIVRGSRSAMPPREALILLAVVNHPALVHGHAEEFAELEFQHRDADLLRGAILAVDGEMNESAALRKALAERGLGALLARIETGVTHPADWPAREGAADEDVRHWWNHIVSLHRKSRSLNKELAEAERALGAEPSEAHLAWLRDVQSRLAALEGTETEIEGFGLLSGRQARSV